MSEAYQYALWRAVPDAQREESINVGVILYSPRLRFLDARAELDRARLRAMFPAVDVAAVDLAIRQRLAVAAGAPAGGPVSALDASERFGFLVAPSSTVLRPGPVHTGLCDEAEGELERLFARLVLQPAS